MDFVIRPGGDLDFEAILAIQASSPETSAWTPEALRAVLGGSADYGLLVALRGEAVAAFLLWRGLPDDETEILSVAAAPAWRRRGAASALLLELLSNRSGACFLELRESNLAARRLYGKLGFEECGLRRAYYHHPVEDAVVMRRIEVSPKDATGGR